jgi:hypothetical protein
MSVSVKEGPRVYEDVQDQSEDHSHLAMFLSHRYSVILGTSYCSFGYDGLAFAHGSSPSALWITSRCGTQIVWRPSFLDSTRHNSLVTLQHSKGFTYLFVTGS